jgi:hypothetical protein
MDVGPSEMEVDVGEAQVQQLNKLVGEFIAGQILHKPNEALIAEILSGTEIGFPPAEIHL